MKDNPLEKEIFSITSFAEFSRTTRDTLLYYDKIGLLSPVSRMENNYRFYSLKQLSIVNLIRTCQALGMTLADIKSLVKKRTPEEMLSLLARQIDQIDEELSFWVRSKKLLQLFHKTIGYAYNVNEERITVQYMPAEAIVLGDLNDFSGDKSGYAALLDFYKAQRDKDPTLDLNYPVWGMISENRIKNHDWNKPDRYYFYNPEGYDKKPAALYAIGYARGGFGQSMELYERLLDYIDENGFEVSGPAYEEYPLNEICIIEEKDYLMRVSITVREK